ncbi:MAG: futalosine hydrolase [Geopsychrobacter sp.]|nr:futalosine hydrolase [Geopsychrobacter sp.]
MICLVAATPHETKLLRRQLPLEPDPLVPGRSFSCSFCDEDILLLHSGIGGVSAALHLTRLLERISPEFLLVFGCGGSYPASGLLNGDLALATTETFGDLGAATELGFVPLTDLGLENRTGEPALFVQYISLMTPWFRAAADQLRQATAFRSRTIGEGPFVTVNRISGTEPLCLDLERRSNGLCENMEGAALAQVAAEYEIPLLELRGISNPCGTQDRTLWDLPAGMEVAQRAVLYLLKGFSSLRSRACS